MVSVKNEVRDPLMADPWFGSLGPAVQQRLRAAVSPVCTTPPPPSRASC